MFRSGKKKNDRQDRAPFFYFPTDRYLAECRLQVWGPDIQEYVNCFEFLGKTSLSKSNLTISGAIRSFSRSWRWKRFTVRHRVSAQLFRPYPRPASFGIQQDIDSILAGGSWSLAHYTAALSHLLAHKDWRRYRWNDFQYRNIILTGELAYDELENRIDLEPVALIAEKALISLARFEQNATLVDRSEPVIFLYVSKDEDALSPANIRRAREKLGLENVDIPIPLNQDATPQGLGRKEKIQLHGARDFIFIRIDRVEEIFDALLTPPITEPLFNKFRKAIAAGVLGVCSFGLYHLYDHAKTPDAQPAPAAEVTGPIRLKSTFETNQKVRSPKKKSIRTPRTQATNTRKQDQVRPPAGKHTPAPESPLPAFVHEQLDAFTPRPANSEENSPSQDLP